MSGDLPNLVIVLKAALGCLLFITILKMAVIDCQEMILPNRLNAILAAGGIGQSVVVGQPLPIDAALGALFGFVVLSVIAALFRHARGIEGLGLGDQKLSAAAGLWIGWEEIAPMLLIASTSALIFVIARSAKNWKFDMSARVPFGPFLGLGTGVCWLKNVASGS